MSDEIPTADEPFSYDEKWTAVVPYRLAAWDAPSEWRSDELEKLLPDTLSAVRKEALEWQTVGASADFWESAGITAHVDRNRPWELAGVMAAAGEQLGLAHGAAVEIALWQDSIARNGDRFAAELGMRAMAEVQGHYVLGCGHAVVNAVARMLATDRDLAGRLSISPNILSRFPPFSTHRDDWIMFGERELKGLASALRGPETPDAIKKLLVPLRELRRSAEWRQLDERRGEDYHRWRPQTAGISGVSRSTPWVGDGLGVGAVRPYTDADGRAAETADISSNAMLVLARAMRALHAAWRLASPLLIGVSYEDEGDGKMSMHIGRNPD